MEDHLQYSVQWEKPTARQNEQMFVKTGFIWVQYGRRNNKMLTVMSGWWFLVTMIFSFYIF